MVMNNNYIVTNVIAMRTYLRQITVMLRIVGLCPPANVSNVSNWCVKQSQTSGASSNAADVRRTAVKGPTEKSLLSGFA